MFTKGGIVMKKIIIVILCVVLLLTGCGIEYKDTEDVSKSTGGGYFTVIKEWNDRTYGCAYHYQVAYANDTKVKYLTCMTVDGITITPLYNADGSLQVYEENEK